MFVSKQLKLHFDCGLRHKMFVYWNVLKWSICHFVSMCQQTVQKVLVFTTVQQDRYEDSEQEGITFIAKQTIWAPSISLPHVQTNALYSCQLLALNTNACCFLRNINILFTWCSMLTSLSLDGNLHKYNDGETLLCASMKYLIVPDT